MIRIAILEYEKESKEIIFQFGKIFKNVDWTFRHFWKASELAKAMKDEEYQIFVFDEMFKTPRLESVFVHDNPNALFIYICDDPTQVKGEDGRERMIYIQKNALVKDLEDKAQIIMQQARQSEMYSLVYNGVHVNLPVQDVRITAVDPLVDHLRDDRRDAQLGQRKTENRNKIKNKEFSIFFRKIPYQSHDLLQKERDNRLSLIVDKY